jgi:hypothetical protein
MNEKRFDFPTEVIELPSKGLLYPEGHPLRKGYIEIKRMTAREEDILASQSLIRKGVVLDKLFESIVVEPGVNINDIFIGDKNAILLATRVLGYGPSYEVEITDPFTLEQQKVNVDLSQVKTRDFDESIINDENRYKYKLPNSGVELEFKLLTHGDEVEINKEIQALERLSKKMPIKGDENRPIGQKRDTASFDVTTRLKYMILSVDGNSDRGYITKWVQNQFLALDTKAFRKYVKNLSPDMDMKFEFTSDITDEKEVLDIPFGVSFFYPSE